MSMIEFHDVQKYYEHFHALIDINLEIDKGETVVLIGPSGSGKSTLVRTINGLERIQAGKLIVNNHDLSSPNTNFDILRRDVGMVFQHFYLYANKTVLENIMLAPRIVLKMPEEQNRTEALKLLDMVGLKEKANNMPSQISGGQQQRVAIARSLAMKPRLLLFDEPTSALDPEMIDDVLQVIKRVTSVSDMTSLIVTHEMGFAKEVANRVIFMDAGQIVEDDQKESFFQQPKTERARKFLSKIITH
ncbi:Phosphonate-transporting ATPase [Bombilactobacillus mellis]|uniref:Phosphonate-transporting ATPase n=1 Tax=Bombilactobacillus mellis TaxID=1218508 RepID=A0A0F4KP32_9LACO|nr:amino acid ABC transporter ATP-binding protein [Bombilactobacillus mellis]KJY48417.1 Phosphonate-transporting ATPase [Bombilactobacillus mellis]NUF26068.1 amino acid ABC transporter ATP-binding protein [Bombilactobacillus mellis]NUF98832.1 amino acid ABC transporter ATP-binding protein [Bombilactobacillus mellis]NUG39690.1 amino acid ABC transporter ATP-binding protein [Bombilactobacillus mellis]